jgi:anti-sigma B factor antagonist
MPETPFHHLDNRIEQGVLVLTITARQIEGELIAGTLSNELQAAVAEAGCSMVVIDLGQIQYISSVALGPLLKLRRTIRDEGGQMILCNLSRSVGDVFYTTRLVSSSGDFTAPFEIAPDVPTAVARLAGTGETPLTNSQDE